MFISAVLWNTFKSRQLPGTNGNSITATASNYESLQRLQVDRGRITLSVESHYWRPL